MNKVLILGNGYVGKSLAQNLEGLEVSLMGRSQLDYHNASTLSEYLSSNKIDYVIGAFGFTGTPNVDQCEVEKDKCVLLNRTIPLLVASVCAQAGIKYGHVSSGCIYNRPNAGDITNYTESDEPNFGLSNPNASFYSKTKHEAEEGLKYHVKSGSMHIWRIRMPFDGTWNPKNYINKISKYDTLLAGEYNSLTSMEDLATVVKASVAGTVPPGVYNVVNTGAVNAKDVAELLKNAGIGRNDWVFIKYDDMKNSGLIKANRSNCVLSNAKISSYVNVRGVFGALIDSIQRMKELHESEGT